MSVAVERKYTVIPAVRRKHRAWATGKPVFFFHAGLWRAETAWYFSDYKHEQIMRYLRRMNGT